MKKFPCTPVGTDFINTARHVYKAEVIIKASPSRIFDYLEDAHSWTVWADPIERVEWTSAKPFGIGTTRTVYMQGGMVGWETFIAWDRGRHMAFCFTDMSRNMAEKFAEDYKVIDMGDGRCHVTWTMAIEPKGASRFILPLFGPLMGMMNRRWFKKFGALVEQDKLVTQTDDCEATAA
ncbi:polyketide cyclase/dehydrase/lipid transport protein [Sinobacterium caligoides]|uniref:Polyketide cyclase/dehydrase/lipid transport protein n=1 Tax=Sinobacterium caligoides TaxID=933926 RepID=A0A3N2DPI7_9GAMM|nr:SRPBCC family protein [Sinobacterium caligoides]ROS01734.1 polyketide cyclase/dehydrase/lipid transport protein [Sinobacterium caligoides]